MSDRRSLDWSPRIIYWVPDGGAEPDVPWPDNWESYGYPYSEPFHTRDDQPRRAGWEYVNEPMYAVTDLDRELEFICDLLENLPPAERAKWDALDDRKLVFAIGRADAEDFGLFDNGFTLSASLLRRVDALSFRLSITLQLTDQFTLRTG